MSSLMHLFTLSLMCGVQESCGVKVIPKYLSSVENSIISPFIFSTSVVSCSLGFPLEKSIAKVFFVEKDKPFPFPQVVILISALLAFLTMVPGSIPIMVKNLSSANALGKMCLQSMILNKPFKTAFQISELRTAPCGSPDSGNLVIIV